MDLRVSSTLSFFKPNWKYVAMDCHIFMNVYSLCFMVYIQFHFLVEYVILPVSSFEVVDSI